ncbi:MAG: hypothetical protein HC877_03400 [Thioploca sp.]|nr:hypothetical protein [Thioploca sp.]
MNNNTQRSQHEIEHGKKLAQDDTELLWGWGTPAGRLRAKRHAQLIATGACLGTGVQALEIECGMGMFAETGAHLVAVDLSPERIGLDTRFAGIGGSIIY